MSTANKNLEKDTILIGNLYQSAMDRGTQPLSIKFVKNILANIRCIRDKDDVATTIAEFAKYHISNAMNVYINPEESHSTQLRVLLGPGKITLPDKQGEATAAPLLIKDLFQFPQKIPNGIISFDCAMTTPQITETIIETGNDYLGSLKGFNGNVYTSIAEYDWGSVEVLIEKKEKNHGREEERELKIIKLSDLSENNQNKLSKYTDSAIIVQVQRKRLISKTQSLTNETAYYVGSSALLNLTAKEIYKIQREHWLIENRSNYVRDVVMQEDNCFTKSHKASRSLGAIRDLVLNAAFLDGGGEIKNYLTHFSSKFSELLVFARSLEIYQMLSNYGVFQT
jgi:predicted transposase YbfD/YdcC